MPAGRTWCFERQRRPGEPSPCRALELTTLELALPQAEAHVLARGGLLGAEAEALVGSPVSPSLARRMFSELEAGRFRARAGPAGGPG
jgi:hypothetical protein